MELPNLTASEYKRAMEAMAQAEHCIGSFGNWSASPWLVHKCGADALVRYLEQRTGKPLTIRTAVYYALDIGHEHSYYIVEVKKS